MKRLNIIILLFVFLFSFIVAAEYIPFNQCVTLYHTNNTVVTDVSCNYSDEVQNVSMTLNSSKYCVLIDSRYTTERDYAFSMFCNASDGSNRTFVDSFTTIEPSTTAYDKKFYYYFAFLLIPIALFFLGYKMDDNWISMLSGALTCVFGIYIAINQFPLLPNLFLTEGFYIVLICLGGFIFVASALDELGGSGL